MVDQAIERTERGERRFDAFLLCSETDRSHADAVHVELSKLKLDVFYDDRCVRWGDDSRGVIDNALVSSDVIAAILSDRFFRDENSSSKRRLTAALRRFNDRNCGFVGLLIHISENELMDLWPSLAGCTLINFSSSAEYEIWARKVQENVKGFHQLKPAVTQSTSISPENPMKFLNIRAILSNMREMMLNPSVLVDGLQQLAEASLEGGSKKSAMKTEGGFELIAEIFSRYPHQSNVYRKGLGVVAMMCYQTDDNRQHAGKCHIPQYVIHSFKEFCNMADIIQEACACVTNLANNKQNHQQFLDAKIIALIADIMARNRHHLLLQRWTCSALFVMCRNSPSGISQFMETKNWLDLVMGSLHFTVKSDAGSRHKRDSILQEWACKLIRGIGSVGRVVARDLIDRGVLQECEEIRQEFVRGSAPFKAATQTICTLMQTSADQELGGDELQLDGDVAHLHWLLATARSVRHCVGVQAYSLAAIANISASVRRQISRFDGFQYVVDVMTSDLYQHHAGIQQRACQVLACYCYQNDANRLYAGECGAVKSVLDCISRFAYEGGNRQVYQEALAALTNMCSGIARNKATVADYHGVLLIIEAMQQFENDIDVTRWGAAALSVLCKDDERNSGMCSSSGVEVLIEALEKRLRDEVTVRWVCQTLTRVSIQSDPQRRRAAHSLHQAENLYEQHRQSLSLIQEAIDRVSK